MIILSPPPSVVCPQCLWHSVLVPGDLDPVDPAAPATAYVDIRSKVEEPSFQYRVRYRCSRCETQWKVAVEVEGLVLGPAPETSREGLAVRKALEKNDPMSPCSVILDALLWLGAVSAEHDDPYVETTTTPPRSEVQCYGHPIPPHLAVSILAHKEGEGERHTVYRPLHGGPEPNSFDWYLRHVRGFVAQLEAKRSEERTAS